MGGRMNYRNRWIARERLDVEWDIKKKVAKISAGFDDGYSIQYGSR
jgi:hypothetical protein